MQFFAHFCPVFAEIQQISFLNSEVTEPIFIMFSNDVMAFVPRLTRAYTRRYCILFWNIRTKSERGQFPRQQKRLQNKLVTIATSLELLQNLSVL